MDKYACRISVKTRTCFHGFTYVFLGIHVRVFRKTCTNKKTSLEKQTISKKFLFLILSHHNHGVGFLIQSRCDLIQAAFQLTFLVVFHQLIGF